MFILDSLFMSGFRWVLNTVVTAAETEMNDDTALREQLLAAEMRREMGEISDEEFAEIESDLLARIREIKARREGGSGPIAFGAMEASPDTQFAIEATVSGDFHETDAARVPFPAEPVTAGERSGTVIEGPLVDAAPRARTSEIKRRVGVRANRATSEPRKRRGRRTIPASRKIRTS
jgi:hypothetical protein